MHTYRKSKPKPKILVLKKLNQNRTEPKPNRKIELSSVGFDWFVRFIGFLHTPSNEEEEEEEEERGSIFNL